MPEYQAKTRRDVALLNDTEWIGLGLLAIAALILEHGFHLSARWVAVLGWVDLALSGICLFDFLGGLVFAERRRQYLRSHFVEGALALWLIVVFSAAAIRFVALRGQIGMMEFLHTEMGLTIALVQVYLALHVGVMILGALRAFFALNCPAPLLVAVSYVAVILAGSALLMLPKASADGVPSLGWMEAFFTSASAVTVTGLTIVDAGARLSLFGQSVLMVLFQIGGISLVAVVALLAYTEGRRMSLQQINVLRATLGITDVKDVKSLLRLVIGFAFAVEAVGACALFLALDDGTRGAGELGFWSLFHAVSAFCSAGFSLQPDSLTRWAVDPAVNLTVACLVLLGGLGFPVLLELVRRARAFDLGRWRKRNSLNLAERPPYPQPLSLQTRYSVGGMLLLFLVGFLFFWVMEGWFGAWRDLGAGETFWASFFHAAISRTAGFNSFPVEEFGRPMLVVVMGLMVIGAGPISTGGGLKTVTFAVLLQTLRAYLGGKQVVVANNRTIPTRIVLAAVGVLLLYLAVLIFTFFALSIAAPDVPWEASLFESISAVSTVGLSLGATSQVGSAGQLFLVLAMVVGRIGPLTLAIGLMSGRERAGSISYPQEELIVG